MKYEQRGHLLLAHHLHQPVCIQRRLKAARQHKPNATATMSTHKVNCNTSRRQCITNILCTNRNHTCIISKPLCITSNLLCTTRPQRLTKSQPTRPHCITNLPCTASNSRYMHRLHYITNNLQYAVSKHRFSTIKPHHYHLRVITHPRRIPFVLDPTRSSYPRKYVRTLLSRVIDIQLHHSHHNRHLRLLVQGITTQVTRLWPHLHQPTSITIAVPLAQGNRRLSEDGMKQIVGFPCNMVESLSSRVCIVQAHELQFHDQGGIPQKQRRTAGNG